MSEVDERPVSAQRRRALLRWILFVGLAFGAVALIFGAAASRIDVESPLPFPPLTADEGSRPQPDFRLATLDGGMLGPPDFPGEVVVIDFWASWCGPCRVQEAHLEELHQELSGKGVRFLGVNVGESEETVRRFVAETPFPYPVLLDPDSELTNSYGIYSLPTLLIVDPGGEVSYLQGGVHSSQMIRREIEAISQSATAS